MNDIEKALDFIYNKDYEKRVRLFYLDHAAAEILDAMGNVKETLEF